MVLELRMRYAPRKRAAPGLAVRVLHLDVRRLAEEVLSLEFTSANEIPLWWDRHWEVIRTHLRPSMVSHLCCPP